ncbi:unnamed protein product [Caenorhabditis angaria]|uniref:Protein kinase domain-containing protein n=1 Tax=Caenorhabditis angaria TaxID=860376 RepID=A0A9P1IZL9_9PELO|nr:unnamed protein product [Caenorhabditis angaria]
MRRSVGSHIRTNRQKLSLLHNALDDQRIAPSLRSDHVRTILQNRRQTLSKVPEFTLIVDRPPSNRQQQQVRRRSFPKEESPRSGLKPLDTHGLDSRRKSSTATLAERRREEQRKYSTFGIEAPISVEIEIEKIEIVDKAKEKEKEKDKNTIIEEKEEKEKKEEKHPENWTKSFRTKMRNLKKSISPVASSRSAQGISGTSEASSSELTVNTIDTKMKKSISFSESTRNVIKKSFRVKVSSPRSSSSSTNLFPKSTDSSMERLGRVWNRLSIRRTSNTDTSKTRKEEEDDMTPEKTKEVFQMFNGTPQRRKSEVSNRVVLNQLHNQKPRTSNSSVEAPRNALRRNSTDTQVFNNNTNSKSFRDHNAPCSSDEERVNPRRNSVFVKRGSMTMEPIKKVDLEDVYTVNKQLGTGRFGYIKLAEHKQSSLKIAIKFFPRPQTKQADFVREYNYSFFLSPHQHIIDTYEGMFQASNDTAFFFVQEFCPCASLREAVENTNQTGIGEEKTKKVFAAVLSAIEFMHDENLVHRNLKAENILIFDAQDYSKVKVTDFGLTRKVDATVKYLEYVNNYHAAELCDTVVNEVLTVNKSTDIWALGIIFFYCMKGRFPWQKASIMCKPYWEWEQWLKRKNPTLPKKFLPFSEKALKLFKKSLTPRVKDRWSAKDMRKCMAKEKLLKSVKKPDDVYYVMMEPSRPKPAVNPEGENPKKKSTLHQWISTTLTAMAEISEQVVSARDD